MLLEAGANPNILDCRKQSPLCICLKKNYLKLANYMIAKGATRLEL